MNGKAEVNVVSQYQQRRNQKSKGKGEIFLQFLLQILKVSALDVGQPSIRRVTRAVEKLTACVKIVPSLYILRQGAIHQAMEAVIPRRQISNPRPMVRQPSLRRIPLRVTLSLMLPLMSSLAGTQRKSSPLLVSRALF